MENIMSNDEITEKDIIIRNYRTSDYQATLEILRELNDLLDIGFDEKQWRESSGLRQFIQHRTEAPQSTQ